MTKIKVCQTCVVTTLLYAGETWVVYRDLLKQLVMPAFNIWNQLKNNFSHIEGFERALNNNFH